MTTEGEWVVTEDDQTDDETVTIEVHPLGAGDITFTEEATPEQQHPSETA